MKATKRVFLKKLPSWEELKRKTKAKNIICFYDNLLLGHPMWAEYLSSFPLGMGFPGGEGAKQLSFVAQRMELILKLTEGFSRSETLIFSVGGGSLGDLSGFIASTLKRGVRLCHLPTTWLAAIDSAHGGKTALNVGPYKNQVGSFYPAETVYLVQEAFKTLSPDQEQSAHGEALKMALIVGGGLYKDWLKGPPKNLWSQLPKLIEAKYKVVSKDPYELKGIRTVLNLGHTWGHAIELVTKKSHGQAVLEGLAFSSRWSFERGYIKTKNFEEIESIYKNLSLKVSQVQESELMLSLLKDKKATEKEKLNFIFLKRPGQTHIEKVKIESLVKEAHRQGLIAGGKLK